MRFDFEAADTAAPAGLTSQALIAVAAVLEEDVPTVADGWEGRFREVFDVESLMHDAAPRPGRRPRRPRRPDPGQGGRGRRRADGLTVGTSACRPARLVLFEHARRRGRRPRRRRGDLDDALAAYRAGCDVEHRARTVDTTEVVRAFGAGLRDFGGWVGGVGQAFQDAIGSGEHGYDDVYTFGDDRVLEYLSLYLDPGRPLPGRPRGRGSWLAAAVGLDYDQDEPPVWIGYLAAGSNLGDVMGRCWPAAQARSPACRSTSLTVRVEARRWWSPATLRWPGRSAGSRPRSGCRSGRPRLATASRWVRRVGTGMAGIAGFADQWYAGAEQPLGERAGRAATAAASPRAAVSWGPRWSRASPMRAGAPVCATVAGIAGAFGGSWIGEQALPLIPWMDEHNPARRDLSAVTDSIASPGDVDPGVAATVDLTASDLALAATADDPPLHDEIERLLPDRDLLERVVTTGQAHPAPETTPTGTTIPAAREPAAGTTVGDDEAVRVSAGALGLVAFGTLAVWNGVLTWRGQQPVRWARHEAEHGPAWTVQRSRRQYQSTQGAAYVGVAGGAGFVVIAAGELVQGLLGQPRDWWLMWVAGIAGMALIGASVLFVLLYFWVGVPDRWRPPCQRGWEIVDGELRLVRPVSRAPPVASLRAGPWR